jgi:hypothetical protein
MRVSELCPFTYCTLSLRLSNRYTIVRDLLLFFSDGKIFSVCWLRIWNGSGLLFVRLRADRIESTVVAYFSVNYGAAAVLFSRQIIVKIPNTKFRDIAWSANRVVPDGRTDRQTSLPCSALRTIDILYSV